MASELTGLIQGTSPRRGKGPASVKIINPETGEIFDLGTFDAHVVRMAAGNIGKEATVSWEEKAGKKDPTKLYKTLLDLTMAAGQEGPQEAPGDTNGTGGATPLQGEVVGMAKRPPARVVDSQITQLEDTFALAVRQRELLKSYVQSQFKEGVHYFKGSLFGGKPDSKDVLAQPGAQLVLYAHGYRAVPKILSGPLEAPKDPYTSYTIVVECEILNARNEKVGCGLGSASSLTWSGKYQAFNPRAVDSDKTHNTTIKMAVKRAMVAGAIQTTAASEMFTQDEDSIPGAEYEAMVQKTNSGGGSFRR